MIFKTVILFAAIFFLIFLNSVRQISLAKPIELIRASGEGEKEPKTKIVMAVLGALFLGAGYYIALTTKNPLEAFVLFFVAAVCVIIGTYLLFTAGSGFQLPKSLFGKLFESSGTMTIQLYLSMQKAQYDQAFGIAVVLLIIVLGINFLTKFLTSKFDVTKLK